VNARDSGTLATRAALASVATALILGAVKGWATWTTESVAMLASLADTALDLIASLVTLWGVRIAAAPADWDHRFGHGKAESLAALIQTGLILISAAAIAAVAVGEILTPSPVARADAGLAVSGAAIVLTMALIAYQRSVIRRTGSVAIGADSLHYQSDLLVNVAVMAAFGLEMTFGLVGIDPFFGLGIAGWLAWNAWSGATTAIDQLMDREWPNDRRNAFLSAAAEMPELTGMHDLRTRRSGNQEFAQFHMFVPPRMTMVEAHDVMDRVEEQLGARFPGVELLIHLDPEGHVDMEGALRAEIAERSEL